MKTTNKGLGHITEIREFVGSDAGYIIALAGGDEIRLWINNEAGCRENWGWFMSEENLPDWIGAEVLSVERVDTALNVRKVEEVGFRTQPDGSAGYTDGDGGDIMFVNINTDRGTLQFVAYNCHNGYYGHGAGCVSRFCTVEATL